MAHTVCLQDWITITAGANSQVITQAEADWLDISDFQDVAAYVEIGGNTNTASQTVNLDVQSSPTKDESFFGAAQNTGAAYLVRFGIQTTGGTSSGVQAVKAVRWADGSNVNQVPARFVRWRASFPGSGNPTTLNFRIWLVLNQAGWRAGVPLGNANFGR